jgi:hypothetical protein
MGDGYPDDWDRRRRRVYKRDNYRCQRCGARGGSRGNAELHAHHQTPKSRGGSHRPSNLETLCRECHSKEHGHPVGGKHTGQGNSTTASNTGASRHNDSTSDSGGGVFFSWFLVYMIGALPLLEVPTAGQSWAVCSIVIAATVYVSGLWLKSLLYTLCGWFLCVFVAATFTTYWVVVLLPAFIVFATRYLLTEPTVQDAMERILPDELQGIW